MRKRSVRKNAGYGWRSQRRWRPHRRKLRGFSLAELMIATLLTSVVMLLAWTGLLSAINMSNAAQAVTSRKIELTTALDVMTQEIRQAQAINQSGDLIADGNAVTLEDVVVHSGLGLDEIGNTGEIALYLELPVNDQISSCMTEEGPVPADSFDRVVYDVRESPVAWLPPEVVGRYGRIPEADGSINPCSRPVANDILADSIAKTKAQPDCSGVLSGSNGFHVCQQGENVDLLFKSAISEVNDIPMTGSVTPRAIVFTPSVPQTPEADWAVNLTVHGAGSNNTFNIAWVWSGGPEGEARPAIDRYEMRITETQETNTWAADSDYVALYGASTSTSTSSNTVIIPGTQTDLEYTPSLSTKAVGQVCFTLDAYLENSNKVTSNQVCNTAALSDNTGATIDN